MIYLNMIDKRTLKVTSIDNTVKETFKKLNKSNPICIIFEESWINDNMNI